MLSAQTREMPAPTDQTWQKSLGRKSSAPQSKSSAPAILGMLRKLAFVKFYASRASVLKILRFHSAQPTGAGCCSWYDGTDSKGQCGGKRHPTKYDCRRDSDHQERQYSLKITDGYYELARQRSNNAPARQLDSGDSEMPGDTSIGRARTKTMVRYLPKDPLFYFDPPIRLVFARMTRPRKYTDLRNPQASNLASTNKGAAVLSCLDTANSQHMAPQIVQMLHEPVSVHHSLVRPQRVIIAGKLL